LRSDRGNSGASGSLPGSRSGRQVEIIGVLVRPAESGPMPDERRQAVLEKEIEEALNDQLNKELYSSYLYLSMAAYFESRNLLGFANWMRVQAQEELIHAMKFYDFINERDGRVLLKSIEGPPVEWKSPLEVFQQTSEHERKVTDSINGLVDLSESKSDHATRAFLQWFVTEQVEEEASAAEILGNLELVADSRGGLFMLNRELGQRVFTAPAEPAK